MTAKNNINRSSENDLSIKEVIESMTSDRIEWMKKMMLNTVGK